MSQQALLWLDRVANNACSPAKFRPPATITLLCIAPFGFGFKRYQT